MFVPVWLFFLATGTLMALLVLIWAIRNHQFDDQERARYLPLVDLTEAELNAPARTGRTATYWGLVSIMVINAVAICATLILALRYI